MPWRRVGKDAQSGTVDWGTQTKSMTIVAAAHWRGAAFNHCPEPELIVQTSIVLPDPALGGIASPRSVVPEAERVCRSSGRNTSVSLARLAAREDARPPG